MRSKPIFSLLFYAVVVFQYAGSNARADDVGAHCEIDGTAFDGDPDITRLYYVIPANGKPRRFRLLAGHLNAAVGFTSIELKATGTMAVGSSALSQEPTWKSVVTLPKKPNSVVTGGDFTFTHFDPAGDSFAVGTVQFQTADAHHGKCRFRLPIMVTDPGHILR